MQNGNDVTLAFPVVAPISGLQKNNLPGTCMVIGYAEEGIQPTESPRCHRKCCMGRTSEQNLEEWLGLGVTQEWCNVPASSVLNPEQNLLGVQRSFHFSKIVSFHSLGLIRRFLTQIWKNASLFAEPTLVPTCLGPAVCLSQLLNLTRAFSLICGTIRYWLTKENV